MVVKCLEVNLSGGGRVLYYYDEGGSRYMAVLFDGAGSLERVRVWNGGVETWYDASGNVTIFRRFWTFDGDEPGLAPAPLVYADLMATGDGRCMETARMIYDEHLFRTDA